MPPPRLTIHTSHGTASTIANSTTVIYSLQSHRSISAKIQINAYLTTPVVQIVTYTSRIWILSCTIMVQSTPGDLNRKLPGTRRTTDDKKEKKFEPAASRGSRRDPEA
ncbi:hypothetical protein Adt_39479 [Abeliophyllum distichum]|uniref:Uncharacterized protein n=1 Tax=Abeliophyllum distichum TaxID=126358 RepID=A0ABD1Q575_9LAMI